MQLSKNLALSEVTRSARATEKKISNEPTPEHLENLKLLAEKVFQPLRDHFGVPIKISSGYRSAALNKATPGASLSSQHCKGEAIDIDCGAEMNRKIFDYIRENLAFDQMIWEFGDNNAPSWVHVSYSKSRTRKEILRAVKQNGATVYKPYVK